jgi:CDP-4-dehydro-6-deoxyglucose reductase, E1
MTYKVPLATNSLDETDINAAIKCLKSGNLTAGKKVKEFEEKFADYFGVKNAIMVNSGSSANLLAMSALANPLDKKLNYGDEVIVPALTWSTTVFPIIQMGAVPVFVDSDVSYQMAEAEIPEMITKKTRAIMPVHILGNMCNMRAIKQIAKEHNLFVIEDTCEALGSKYNGKYAGTIGDIGTYSFYFTHHISTIEGGMVVSNNSELVDTMRMMRNHGMTRDSNKLASLKKKYPNIDPRFMFGNIGYNIRSSDLNATLGITQLDKLDEIIKARKFNAFLVNDVLEEYSDVLELPTTQDHIDNSWFAYPITVNSNTANFTVKEFKKYLESKSIETRPLIAGNLAEQPIFKSGKVKFRKGNLFNAQKFMENGFYFGIHQDVNMDYLLYYLDEFLSERVGKLKN